jgi:hypothetical protein
MRSYSGYLEAEPPHFIITYIFGRPTFLFQTIFGRTSCLIQTLWTAFLFDSDTFGRPSCLIQTLLDGLPVWFRHFWTAFLFDSDTFGRPSCLIQTLLDRLPVWFRHFWTAFPFDSDTLAAWYRVSYQYAELESMGIKLHGVSWSFYCMVTGYAQALDPPLCKLSPGSVTLVSEIQIFESAQAVWMQTFWCYRLQYNTQQRNSLISLIINTNIHLHGIQSSLKCSASIISFLMKQGTASLHLYIVIST